MPRFSVVLLFAGALPTMARAADAPAAKVDFATDVRPILARNCYACHGPDEGQRKAKLRLDTRDGAFAARESGPILAPGDLDSSELHQRITSDDPEQRMPPGGPEKALPPEQRELIARWIRQGARWEDHWSFRPLERPTPPASANAGLVRNPIDHFVQARLASEGLASAPEADRATLIRRVALDLTGLPPSPEEVDRFLKNDRPDAYERLVDGLLDSPAYGERWARVWLDLARYADTKGYEKDLTRNIWRYRDWVIAAFNDDMPYDRFTAAQLAGDLLPDARPDDLLATAFHRNTLTNDEGGTDDEEFRVAAVKDRVDTTMQVWMGLTMGCAKCHTHKYDPIAHTDYYRFYAFFNQTQDNDRFDDSPAEPLPAARDRARADAARAESAKLEAELYAETPARLVELAAWESARKAAGDWTIAPAETTVKAESNATLKRLGDGSYLAAGVGPATESYAVTIPLPAGRLTAVRLEALPDSSLPKSGVGRSKDDGNFVLTGLSLTLKTKDGAAVELKLAKGEADFEQSGYPVEHVLKNPDSKHHGWAVAPRVAEPHQAVFTLSAPVEVPEGSKLALQLDHRFEYAYPGFALGRFRIAATAVDAPKVVPPLPSAIAASLAVSAEKRTAGQRAALLRHMIDTSPATKASRDAIAAKRAEADGILNAARTPIVRELPADKRRVTKVHRRGNFLDPGDPVDPAVPGAFHAWPSDAPRNRLGVARWLMDPANPLTARVAANRHWAQFFGRGLVETQEDFGSQGRPPSHPELLDWLAVEFRDGGWSFKKLCRVIVTSATYRQSSKATPELLEKDRENRLLARGPRFRLEAEIIRDQALAVSGILSSKLYGRSVMPYQPDGIWRSTYNTDRWITSPGEDKHRRSLYTFIKRTSPYPAMLALDAPSREYCTVRRISTNTPLQALVTLNDPVYVEAAQALARRMVREGGPAPADRIGRGLKLALGREPKAREIEALSDLYAARLSVYESDPDAARKLAAEPIGPLPEGVDPAEAAALTSVANVILNLDEFLTRN